MFATLNRKYQSWSARPPAEKGWFFVAYPLLGVARATILLVPFKWIARTLGQDAHMALQMPLATPQQMQRALAIGRGVRLAATYTPWQSKCLAQAMVASWLLRRCGLPYGLYFGVRKDPDSRDGLAAHAWVSSGPAAVTGGRGCFNDFSVVYNFVNL